MVHSVLNNIPNFCTIEEFIVTPLSEILFICKALETACYSSHYHSYIVNSLDNIVVIRYPHLHDLHPLSCATPFGSTETYVAAD